MSFKRLGFAFLPMLTAGGCMTPSGDIASADPAFGEAVKYDMAIQVIDPDPVYDDDGAQPGDNGAVGAAAVARYRSGENLDQHRREARQGTASIATGAGGGSPPQ